MESREILPQIARLQAAPLEDGQTGFDVWQIFDFLRRRWKLIMLAGLAAVAIATAYVQTAIPLYSASSEMLLQARQDKLLGRILSKDAGGGDQGLVDPAELENQIVLIESVALLRRVVERENLVSDPEFRDRQPTWLAKTVQAAMAKVMSVIAPKPPSTIDGEVDQNDPITVTAGALRSAVAVTRSGKSSALLITVSTQSPRKSARLANAVSTAYVDELAALRMDAARNGANWLNESLDNLRNQLKVSEEAVAKFRAENKLTATRSTGTTMTEQQLSELNTRLVAAQTETAEKKAKLDQADQVRQNRGNAQAIPEVLRSPLITTLRSQQAETGRKEADLVARYGPQHPLVVNVRAEKRDIDSAIGSEIQRILITIKSDYDVALARQRQIEESLKQLTGQSNVDDQISVRLRELERTAAANKTLYEDFLSRAKLLEEQTSFTPTEARVLTQAVPSPVPSWPKKGLTVVLGLFLGLGTGLGAAVLLEFMSAGFTSPRQIEETLNLPVLACLAQLKGRKTKEGSPAFLVIEKPLSRYSEAVRSLRNGIALHHDKGAPKVIQVTSTMPQEGKSTVSLSIALSAADSGQRVLLIDADLRRPSVTDTFGLAGHSGLSDVLAGAVRVSEAVHVDSRSGLQVLPAGSKTKNPPALLSSDGMRMLVEGLAKHFDCIVIDTPPLGPVVDGVIVAQLVDAVVFVAKWGDTPRDAVESAINSLPQRRNVAGVVLNLVDEAKIAKFGKYAFYGYSQYSKYYQE